jgi:hypothetical protein
MSTKLTLSAIIAASLLLSCGVYTFSPSALGGIRSTAIPLFENRTTESGLSEDLVDKLSRAFVNDNTLKVVPEGRADAVLRGAVVSYRREPYTYDENEVVTEYIVRIAMDVGFYEKKSSKAIWEERNLSNWGTYDSVTETENDGRERALNKLVEDILNKTVKGW